MPATPNPSSMVDSRRSLRSIGFPSVDSEGGESLTSPSSSSLGHASGAFDSRRSLQPSNSYGEQPYGSISEHGMLKGNASRGSLAGGCLLLVHPYPSDQQGALGAVFLAIGVQSSDRAIHPPRK